MRLSNTILVISAAALLASDSWATDAGKSSVSTLVSPDQIHAIDAAMNPGNDKRFLRSHQTIASEGDNDVDNVDDDEERLNMYKIRDLVNGRTSTLFTKWADRGYSVDTIKRKLNKLKHWLSKEKYDDAVADTARWPHKQKADDVPPYWQP